METLKLRPRQPAKSIKDEIECWDDDEFLQGVDDINFRNLSTTTVVTNSSNNRGPSLRDSVSSRVSVKSNLDEEGDWQLLLPNDDDLSTRNAIANAKSKGIPIPENVPATALLGGTIKRLGGRRLKKALTDDWGEELEVPKPEEGGLRLRTNDGKQFPDTLRHVSLTTPTTLSPVKATQGLSFMERLQSSRQARADLEKYRDNDETDGFDEVSTIKVSKSRTPLKIPTFNPPPTKPEAGPERENFEDDLELPADGTLRLSARKEAPRTPASQSLDDVDNDWAEGSQGSLGTSLSTRRTGRSNRSSSITALSPSVFSPSLSSCLTAESEDEGLDGLVLPDGPLKFEEVLKKRMQEVSPEPADLRKLEADTPTNDDFFAGIELGDGDVFDSKKLTLNRNIKHKATRQTSPTRRAAMTLTFTNTPPSSTTTRIPKPTMHDRPRSKLEPVSESGGPIPTYKSHSRLAPHTAQSFATGIPTPSASALPPSSGPSTPSRRGLTNRSSKETLRTDAATTTTNTQLLKAKRSMPTLSSRAPMSPSRGQVGTPRPISRAEKPPRPTIPARPKTPVDRSGAESSLASARKAPIPFLPAGSTHAQSHHVVNKPSRTFHRPTSSDITSSENPPSTNRPASRLSNPRRRPTTPSTRKDFAPEALARAAANKQTLKRPANSSAFGDGNELDAFDDLPTSATAESKFIKQPVFSAAKGANNLRAKFYSTQSQSSTTVNRIDSTPRTPLLPQKHDSSVPSWARDTAASRLAREQRTGHINPQPLRHPSGVDHKHSLNTTWKSHATAKAAAASPRHTHSRRPANKVPQKPHLIKPLGQGVHEAKSLQDMKIPKGMQWNPQTFRWEGNETALAPFFAPGASSPKLNNRTSPVSAAGPTGKPALIAKVGNVKGVQVVGGMVFDPQRMCWLKMEPSAGGARGRSESGAPSFTTEDDDEDPFAGLDDLEDEIKGKGKSGGARDSAGGAAGAAGSDDDWAVGEEFDVGPEFVRRQKAEEVKWRRRLEGWSSLLGQPERALEERDRIRELVRHPK